MAKLKYIKGLAFFYALCFCGFGAASFAPAQLWIKGGLIAASLFSLGFLVDQLRLYTYQIRRYKAEQDVPTPPEVHVINAQSMWHRELRQTISELRQCTPDELSAITAMVEESSNLAMKTEGKHPYSYSFARRKLYWDTRLGRYGYTYLPAIGQYSGITRQWMTALTNDLIELGCAGRDKPNTRAYLTSEPEEAMLKLFPETGRE